MPIYESEFKGAQIDARLAAVATMQTAISNLEAAVAAKYSKPANGIPETDLDASVQAALALARTAVQSLSDYYTKAQVDDITAAIAASVNSTIGEVVTALPSAGADTLGKMYYVGPDANGFYDRYVTSYDGSTYSWLALGSTEIDLSQYATVEQLNAVDQKVGETETVSGEADIDTGTWTNGSVRHSTGANASSTANKRTGFIDISAHAGKTLIYSRQQTTASSPLQGLAFYDSSETYISGQAWIGDAAEDALVRTEISVPATAKYVKFCVIGTFVDSAYMKYPTSTVHYISGLGKDVADLNEALSDVDENIYKETAEPLDVTTQNVYDLIVGSAPALTSYTTYKCIAVTGLQPGDKVAFHGYAGNSYATWGKAKNGIVTFASGKGIEVNTTVECDGTFDAIYVNAYNSYLNPPSASIIHTLNAFDYVDKVIEEIPTPTRKSLNILCFGNSFTQGSMGYVPAILKRLLPDYDITVDMAVLGASPLAQHLAYFTDTEQRLADYIYRINANTGNYEREGATTGVITTWTGYEVLESINGGRWSSSTMKIPAILARHDWNIVTFQQRGATDGGDFDVAYAPYIYPLQAALAAQIGHKVQLGWIMTHGTYKSTKAARLADWEAVKTNAEKVMLRTGADLLLPYGTAVQNLRTTTLDALGDYENGGALQVDEGHLQQGIGCLAAGYACALAIVKALGFGALGIVADDLRPDAAWLSSLGVNWNIGTGVIGITDFNCMLAQIAATKAVSNPYELTDISPYETITP